VENQCVLHKKYQRQEQALRIRRVEHTQKETLVSGIALASTSMLSEGI